MATKRSVGTLGDKDLRGKKVFLRADLNILLDDSQNITDDNCIRASVLSIKFLMAKGAKAILANHLVSTRFQHSVAHVAHGYSCLMSGATPPDGPATPSSQTSLVYSFGIPIPFLLF